MVKKVGDTLRQVWACGRGDMSTPSFGSHLNPISTRGGQIIPTLFWCPHQVLKATGAPALRSLLNEQLA